VRDAHTGQVAACSRSESSESSQKLMNMAGSPAAHTVSATCSP
jgi:hypothetical protein